MFHQIGIVCSIILKDGTKTKETEIGYFTTFNKLMKKYKRKILEKY